MKMELESFEEKNPPDLSITEILTQLRQYWPNLQKSDIKFHYHGSYNVFVISQNTIVRIPDRDLRNQTGLKMLEKEKGKLDVLNDSWLKSPLYNPQIRLPKLTIIHKQLPIPFSAYSMIPGVSLERLYKELSLSEQQKAAKEIRVFLDFFHSKEFLEIFLHHFPEESGFSPQIYRNHWEKKLEFIRDRIFGILPPSDRKWLVDLFESFLAHSEYFKFTPTVTHGDFDSSNILYDQKTGVISGIIDFEDCKVGDPAADLLFYREGIYFQKIIRKSEIVSYDSYLTERSRFLYARTCVPYLEWGILHNRKDMISYGRRRLKALKKMFPNS